MLFQRRKAKMLLETDLFIDDETISITEKT